MTDGLSTIVCIIFDDFGRVKLTPGSTEARTHICYESLVFIGAPGVNRFELRVMFPLLRESHTTSSRIMHGEAESSLHKVAHCRH